MLQLKKVGLVAGKSMRKIAGAAGFRVGLGLAVASAIAASALVFVPETANAVGAPETIPGTSKEEAASSSLLGIEGEGSQEASHGAELSEQPGQDASAEGEFNLPSVDDEASAQATSPSGVGAGADEGPSAVDSIEPRQFGHSQGAVSGGEAELSEPGVQVNSDSLQARLAGTCSLNEREKSNDWLQNDALSSANSIPLGSTICGYIGHERDTDFFRFDTSAGSHRVTFKFDAPKVGGNLYKVRIYDDSQNYVKSWNVTAAAANGTWLSKQLTRLPSGTGYVEVLPLSNKVVGKKYSLSVAKVNAAAVDSTSASEGCLAEREEPKDWLVNDSMSSADALALGTTICGYIGHERDTDFYAFSNDGGAHGVKFSFDNAYDPPTKYYFTAAALDGRGKTLRTWKLNAGDWKGKTVEVSFPKGAAFISVSNTGSAFWGEAYKLSIVPVKKGAFIDVSSKHTFFKEIEWMHSTGLSTGTKTSKGLAYQPSSAVSRQAMAAFLYRQSAPKNYKAPRVSPFADVPTSHKFYKEIAWMSESKISTGFKVGNKRHFKPNANVSRSAMAAFLYRIHGPAKGSVPSSAPFADVPRGHQFAKEIAWMKTSKISTGSSSSKGLVYKPNAPVSRAEMAAFLYRAAKL